METGGSFTVAEARQRGMTPGMLRSARLSAPFYGVRSTTAPRDLLARCRSYAAKMRPDAAFASLTAARLWGIPLPSHVEDDVLHVATPHGSSHVGGRGVRGSQYDPTRQATTLRAGMRVLAPASTWLHLGRALEVPDLVAAGDFLVTVGFGSSEPALLEVAALERALRAGRWRGAPRLRAALELIEPGAFSRPESLARVLVVSAGIPKPVPNAPVSPLLRCDLVWPEWRVALDYHGAHHRSATQFARDLPRRELARREGWALVEIAKDDLFGNPFDFLGRLRSRLAERGARLGPLNPRKLARITP
jgi:hypothetical protein